MNRSRARIVLLASAAAALTAGGVAAEERRIQSEPAPRAGDAGAEVRAALSYYRDLAEWQLRDQLDADSYAGLRRSLGVAVAVVTASPGDALSAALSAEPPVLRTRPVAGGTNSPFGVRKNPFRKRGGRERHSGVDLSAARGTPVHAAGPGRVVKARRLSGYGRVVYIDHGGGVQTRYAHLQKILVEEGDFVAGGGVVGRVGSSGRATGPHLHFEVREDGRAVAPAQILAVLMAPPVELLAELLPDRAERAGKAARRTARRRASKRDRRRRERELRSQRPSS